MMEPILKPFKEQQAPPLQSSGFVVWLRSNFFSTWINSLMTIGLLWVIYQIGSFVINWGFIDAVWFGESAKACPNVHGACWAFVTDRWRLFVYGLYPSELRWRVDVFYGLGALTIAAFVFSFGPITKRLRLTMFIGFPIAAYILLVGGMVGLKYVTPEDFGGLLLTVVIAAVGIFASIPLGLILMLGRTSELKVISKVCAYYIEFWRGVPHIAVIVMFVALLPIFIPDGNKIDIVVRALIAFAAFNSAYMAEVFRGGLQSIPAGQFEASKAIGLSYWKMMGYIILPQAIRNSVPALVNTCISIFKETTIVLLIGFSDFLGIIQLSLEDPKWLGPPHIFSSAYVFAALIYFSFTFGMSKYSLRLENRTNVDH
ncbi:MAG: amino acid ABC transporter permease [Rhodospirillaceae bacterium]|jgi:general L-amino acid transport system permease protein|nr:amino acid ABC transporter permease [Rhodospirillaceae bacterium]